MSSWWQVWLTPPASAVKFAIKVTLAMMLALYIALWCDLERPYWALISAAFLQVRPMSGMVLEKGLSQLSGTAVGCVVGIAIMALFVQAPLPALGSLTLWIVICTYAASVTRNNASYGWIMAATTAMLIVIITASASNGLFSVAVARLTELSLGAVCATLVSSLLWPIRMRDHLLCLADQSVHQAFEHGALCLLESTDSAAIQQTLTGALSPLTQLETDSQAARYEGPEGQGRIRASHVLTRHILRMMCIFNAIQQLLHHHREHLPPPVRTLADETVEVLQQHARQRDVAQTRQQLQALRHQALAWLERQSLDPEAESAVAILDHRLVLGLREALGHALVILDAREAMHTPTAYRLKAASLAWHRDRLTAMLNGLRSGLVFMLLAALWLSTGWDNGQTAMLLGTLFSAMFAIRDNPVLMASRFACGMLAAIPSALIFGHILLAEAQGFGMLSLALFPPLWLGLLGAANPHFANASLGFIIGNIILTMPGNGMDLSLDGFVNRAIGVTLGLAVVVAAFRMLPDLPASLRRRRLVTAIVRDLHRLEDFRLHEAESRFSGRMADRLLQMAQYDHPIPEDCRCLFELGLTGLDLGYTSMHLRRQLRNLDSRQLDHARRRFVHGLAEDYADSARGQPPSRTARYGEALIAAIGSETNFSTHQRLVMAGLVERLGLSLQRQADHARAVRERG